MYLFQLSLFILRFVSSLSTGQDYEFAILFSCCVEVILSWLVITPLKIGYCVRWKAQIDHQGENITPKETLGSHTLPITTETWDLWNIMGKKSEYFRAEFAPGSLNFMHAVLMETHWDIMHRMFDASLILMGAVMLNSSLTPSSTICTLNDTVKVKSWVCKNGFLKIWWAVSIYFEGCNSTSKEEKPR